jgi:uncharacterized protein YndB with AHSA1/START domain
MKPGTTGAATVHVDAPPRAVYDLVTDVRRMGEWSPETKDGEWIDGASGAVVGARFRGRNRRGLVRWSTTPRVVVAEEGREFAFVTDLRGKELTKWTYRFEPDGPGTRLTESFEIVNSVAVMDAAMKYMLRISDRAEHLVAAMHATIQSIKRVAELVGRDPRHRAETVFVVKAGDRNLLNRSSRCCWPSRASCCASRRGSRAMSTLNHEQRSLT